MYKVELYAIVCYSYGVDKGYNEQAFYNGIESISGKAHIANCFGGPVASKKDNSMIKKVLKTVYKKLLLIKMNVSCLEKSQEFNNSWDFSYFYYINMRLGKLHN